MELDKLKEICQLVLQKIIYSDYYMDDSTIAKDCEISDKDFYIKNVQGDRGCLGINPLFFTEFAFDQFAKLYPKKTLYNSNNQRYILYNYDAWLEIKHRKHKQIGMKDSICVARKLIENYKDRSIKEMNQKIQEYNLIQQYKSEIQYGDMKIVKDDCLVRCNNSSFPFQFEQRVEYLDKESFEQTIESVCQNDNIMNIKDYINRMGIELISYDTWTIEYEVTGELSDKNRENLILRVVNKELTKDKDYVAIAAGLVYDFMFQIKKIKSLNPEGFMNHENQVLNQTIQPQELDHQFYQKYYQFLYDNNGNKKFRSDKHVYFFSNKGLWMLNMIQKDLKNSLFHLQSTDIMLKMLKIQSQKTKEQIIKNKLQIQKLNDDKVIQNKIIKKQQNILDVEIVQEKIDKYNEKLHRKTNGEIYIIALKQENEEYKQSNFDNIETLKEHLKIYDDIVYVGQSGIDTKRKYQHIDQLRSYLVCNGCNRNKLKNINDQFQFVTLQVKNQNIDDIEKDFIQYCSQTMKNNNKYLLNTVNNPNIDYFTFITQ